MRTAMTFVSAVDGTGVVYDVEPCGLLRLQARPDRELEPSFPLPPFADPGKRLAGR